MKLITEVNQTVHIISEEKDQAKCYYIEGVFLQGNLKNRNGRVYPMEVLEQQVNEYTENFINQNRAFGELGHPESPIINLERTSHIIKELRKEGNDYIGKAKIMDTPYGKIVKNLIDEGAKLAVSSRGVGSLEEKNGVNYVKDDFKLCTAADIVADPSAPQAFVRGILENKEWIYESGIIREKQLEDAKKQIQKASSRKLEETAIRLFKNFLQEISKEPKQ